MSRLEAINLADKIPPTTLHNDNITDTQSAKKRVNEVDVHKLNFGTSKQQNTHNKITIPSIDIVSHIWLGFSIRDVMTLHRGTETIREHRTNEEFARIRTFSSEILDFYTRRRIFLRIPQMYHQSERLDAFPGHHLHFIQIPRQ